MDVSALTSGVISLLMEGLKDQARSIRGFPWHLHAISKGHHNPRMFEIQVSLNKDPVYSHGNNQHSKVLSIVLVKLLDTLLDGKIMAQVTLPRMQLHHGESSSSWFKQDWRHEPFLVQVSPHAIWALLESNLDHSRIVVDVLEG